MATYTLISSATVGAGGAANITFNSIPQTYTDLAIKINSRSTRNVGNSSSMYLLFNSNTANYTYLDFVKNSTGLNTSTGSAQAEGLLGYTSQNKDLASAFGSGDIYIPSYTTSNYKSFSAELTQENDSATQGMTLTAGLWSNTAAITSITLSISVGAFNFMQYSTAYLYGISNA